MLNTSIKEIDHLKELKDKTKDVSSRNNSDNVYSYASNKIQSSNEIVGRESLNIYNKLGRKATIETKNNIIKGKNKISNIKDNKTIKNTNKGIMNTKNNIKSSNEVIKTSYKMKEHIVNISNKTYKGIKKTVKITINSVKSIIAGTKALISLLIAGGSIAIFIIVIICMIGLLLNSVFGIFFSNEKIDNSITMTSVISSLNQ